MALISRFTRLFRADMHAVLDRIEEPEILLRQSVREMQEDLAQDQRELKLFQIERDGIPARLQEMTSMLQEVQEEIVLCLDADNEQLARSKIRRKLELQQREKQYQSRLAELDARIGDLQARVNTNQQRLDSMRQKLEIFSQDNQQCNDHGQVMTNDVAVTEDDVEVALIREKKHFVQQRTAKQSGGKS